MVAGQVLHLGGCRSSVLCKPASPCPILSTDEDFTGGSGPGIFPGANCHFHPPDWVRKAALCNLDTRQGIKPHDVLLSFFFQFLFCDFYLLGVGLSLSRFTGEKGAFQAPRKTALQRGFSAARSGSGSVRADAAADPHRRAPNREAGGWCEPHSGWT